MSPENNETRELSSRIGGIEERMAAVEARLPALESSAARVESAPERMATLEAWAREVREDVRDIKTSIERRGSESLTSKQWTIGLAVVIVLGLLGLGAQIYLAAHGAGAGPR